MIAAILLASALLAQVPDPAADLMATGAEIVAQVRDGFFDPARGAAWAEANARYAAEARGQDDFAAATRAALRQLNASHTAYYTPDDPEFYGLQAIFRHAKGEATADRWDSIGVDVAPGGFARVVFAGSPAAQAGLRRGDQILRADGLDFHPVRSLRGRSGRAVTLTVRSRRDEPPRDLLVTPRRVDPLDEWREAQRAGARVVAVGEKRVAYMPLFSAAGDEPRDLVCAAIVDQFAAADALILDLRDGWGGANPDFVNLFNPTPPRLEMIDPSGRRSTYDPQWRKPLVLLINGGSRSGKEVVAFAVRKHHLGTLVGATTGGAVLAGRLITLRDGSLLYLAVHDIRVDGERLEGRGVAPDVPVEDDLPFAEGRDPQLDRAF